jgi:hypothetical protein
MKVCARSLADWRAALVILEQLLTHRPACGVRLAQPAEALRRRFAHVQTIRQALSAPVFSDVGLFVWPAGDFIVLVGRDDNAASVVDPVGQRIPPHASNATRRATGLEAAVVDREEMDIPVLSSSDSRVYRAKVAGPAALLVAKRHEPGERQDTPTGLVDKDAHDIYRILVAVQTGDLAARLRQLQADGLAGQVTKRAIDYLNQLFAAGPNAIGSLMAGRAETGVGDPEVVSASVAALSEDLVRSLGR